MTSVHVPIEEMGLLADLPEDDPRRRHVEACPVCRARWLDYESFMNPAPLPADANSAEARRSLGNTLRRELAPSLPLREPARRRLWPWSHAGRWAFATAMAAAAITITLAIRRDRPAVHPALVRGTMTAAGAPLTLAPPEFGADGALQLRWLSHPRATHYEVRLYRADLSEAARWDAGPDTTLDVARARMPAGIEPDAEILWRVVATREGLEIGQSPLGTLRLP